MNVTIRPLDTVTDLGDAIAEIVNGPHPSTLSPARRRERAARLADLFDVRARLWWELALAAYGDDAIPDEYAKACVHAQAKDLNDVRFWRREAGAR